MADETAELPTAPPQDFTEEVVAEGIIELPPMATEPIVLDPVKTLNKLPLTVEKANQLEQIAQVLPGTYYVSDAKQRLVMMGQMHDRWFNKTKNRASSYTKIQKEIESFWVDAQHLFDQKFGEYVAQPSFSRLGLCKRHRVLKSKK